MQIALQVKPFLLQPVLVNKAGNTQAQQQRQQQKCGELTAAARRLAVGLPGFGQFFAGGQGLQRVYRLAHHRFARRLLLCTARAHIVQVQRRRWHRRQGRWRRALVVFFIVFFVGRHLLRTRPVAQCFQPLRLAGRRVLGLEHPLQQVFAEGRQLFVVSALAVDQQNHIDVAGRKTVDQARQQLQFEILYALSVRKNHETLRAGFV